MDDKRPQVGDLGSNRADEKENSPLFLQRSKLPSHKPIPLEQIIGNEEKITYVFQHKGQIGCVHFDSLIGEIYFNGHTARNMTLTKSQWDILEEFYVKLRHHAKFHSKHYRLALERLQKEKTPSWWEFYQSLPDE